MLKLRNMSWEYINEGNAHIVVRIVNTSFVLRLIKEGDRFHDLESIKNSVDFANLVMFPLLHRTRNVVTEEIVEFPQKDLAKFNTELLKVRPSSRKGKSLLSPHAVQASNLTMIDFNSDVNYCIEIKPKEGFLSNKFKKYNKCYYCLKQYLKLREKQISNISNYCPLDLFSGDTHRMSFALHNLIKNPQNNFKMFKNSSVIYDGSSETSDLNIVLHSIPAFHGSISLFIKFLIEILLCGGKNPVIVNDNFESIDHSCGERSSCNYSSILNNECVLKQILDVQRCSENSLQSENEVNDDDYAYVSRILQLLKSNNFNLFDKHDRKEFMHKCGPLDLKMLGAVAKDCSIMISFSSNLSNDENIENAVVNNHQLSYKVAVTDLEPKPVTALPKRKKTEERLVKAYIQSIESNPHTETRAKQFELWQQLITDYLKANKLSTLDIRDYQNSPLFNNESIKRKLTMESIVTIFEDMAKKGRAAATDKNKYIWEIYWKSLDEWGNILYTWACNNGMNNSVCTLFELREGDTTADEEFHGLDINILIKALKSLEIKGKCELMDFDNNQGVKFF